MGNLNFALIFIAFMTMESTESKPCFQKQYILDEFLSGSTFKNITDIAIYDKEEQLLVLQRSYPFVTIWNTNGSFLLEWDTKDLKCPHSLTIDISSGSTVWITDMADHCIKQFTYAGKFIQSLGSCGPNTNGSGLNPLQFDRVTDLAQNSEGFFYVTDGDIGGMNNRVIVLDPDLRLVDVWNKNNSPGFRPLEFNLPHAVYVDWCDRVWITDTNNHRIQIISSNGTFLNEWRCFNDSLIYGIDINYSTNSSDNFVAVTAKGRNGEREIIILPILVNDCSDLANFGACTIQRWLVKKDITSDDTADAMLHEIAISKNNGSLYLAMLPGMFPPLKYIPVAMPPRSDLSVCPSNSVFTVWPMAWSANLLLTPYTIGDLHTAHVEYSAKLHAIHITLDDSTSSVKEFLNIDNNTYIISRNSTTISCSEPRDYGWLTPRPDWPVKCECKGSLNISGVETIAWTCLESNKREWYWLHVSNNSIWRMVLNAPSNPHYLPVIGNYTMTHFVYEPFDPTTQLTYITSICQQKSYPNDWRISNKAQNTKLNGFSYTGCPSFPDWPNFFHLTATMTPVSLNNASPFPTQVVYDWDRESQRTIMCESLETYNAFMFRNNTYVATDSLKSNAINCLSKFNFGPPKPNWMTLDQCECKGIILDNPSLTPFTQTVIAVCPVENNRVFWTWFSTDTGFSPLLFFETLTPADEGTGLALADYHEMHKGSVLIDYMEFEVPSRCLNFF